ncbi:hypothetical protein RND81_03G111900 [Saponaria officinalis]|uniref:Uncharacterized protein n=1 Tax=Saponaria officinalis TaxID=3572 RepID=A0AAW1M6S6_SAPOF
MQTDSSRNMSSKRSDVSRSLGNEAKEKAIRKLHAAEAKLDEITDIRTRLVSENSEMTQSVEQTKREIHDLKVNKPLIEHPTPTINTLYCRVPPPMLYAAELIATEVSTLEEEHKALLSENDGEMEFTQSLKSQLEKLRPELIGTEVSTLEEEHKTLLSENDGEMEFTQSLKSQLEKLRVHIFAFSVALFARTCIVTVHGTKCCVAKPRR